MRMSVRTRAAGGSIESPRPERCPMPPRPYLLNELTWKTVRDARSEVAILPWGATEAHNYHLPYTTDNIQSEEIAARAAERAWQRGAGDSCRSEEHTSELQSPCNLVCRLLLEKKKKQMIYLDDCARRG